MKDEGVLSVLHKDLAECIRLLIKKESDNASDVIHTNLEPRERDIPRYMSTSFTYSFDCVDFLELDAETIEEMRMEECMSNYHAACKLDNNLRVGHVLRMNYLVQRGRVSNYVYIYIYI
jgi:hypothetical protein